MSPFIVPPSTRGKKAQKPLYEILITRFADLIAGRGLENFRVENDLKQEAEVQMFQQVSSTPQLSKSKSKSTTEENDDDDDNKPSFENDETSLTTNSASSASASATAVVNINESNNDNNDTTTAAATETHEISEDGERIFINKYGAHFVYVPSLGRYIARADRKTVRASTIAGRIVFFLQVFFCIIGAWCFLVRSVDCLVSDSSSSDSDSGTTTTTTSSPSSSPSSSTLTSTQTTGGITKTIYPGWQHLSQDRNGFYVFIFFVMLIGGNILQFFCSMSGDRDAGNPGFLSIEGDEVSFEISGNFQNMNMGDEVLSVPQELRRSCKTCGGPQPLRCRHCRNCGRCVPRCDHHCIILMGRCVGSFDYGAFILIITLQAIMGAIALDFLFGSWLSVSAPMFLGGHSASSPSSHQEPIICLNPNNPDAGWFNREFHANGFLMFMIPMALLADVALWTLVGSHIALTFVDTTTYEFARPGKNSHMRYYSITPGLSASNTKARHVSSSPFSERFHRNFINLWWNFGLRSFRRRFNIFRSVDEQLPCVRNGSVDGINFFVATDRIPLIEEGKNKV